MPATTDQVTEWLTGAVERGLGEDGVLEAVDRLGRPDQLAVLVSAVAADRQQLVRCAELSYRHALGFDKLVLVRAEPAFTLRMHVWWPHRKRVAEHIHNHRFSFASAIVQGTLEVSEFAAGQGSPVMAYRESVAGVDRDWELRQLGHANVRLVARARLNAGSRYVLTADMLHQARVPAEEMMTVTLFLETAAVRQTTDVYVERDSAAPMSVAKVAMSPDLLGDTLQSVLAELRTG
jgi:hypothetical protein